PILLHADDIATWTEGSLRILLLKGTVLVEHGVVHARCQQAVAWLDQERFRRSGIMRLEVYAEGVVQLERGPQNLSGPRAILDLSRRGGVKSRPTTGEVSQATQPTDVLYQRAQLVRGPQESPAGAGAIQRTSAKEPVSTPLASPPVTLPVQNSGPLPVAPSTP